MVTQDATTLPLDAAQLLLKQFICHDRVQDPSTLDYAQVQAALRLVAHHSDYQIFGICADTAAEAATALQQYLTALSYEVIPEVASIAGPVYVKYNPKTGRCQVDAYTGDHRGVLVSCQSADDGDVNETFGHLPFDLFVVRSEAEGAE